MSDLYKTNLFLQGAPLPQNFKGTPQEWYEAILERIRIVAPFGFSTFVVGTLKPSSNQGPWLKDGTKWYVWSDDDADYIPLDLTDSAVPPYWVQNGDPAGTPDSDGNYLTPDLGGPEGGPLGGGPLLWFKLNDAGTSVEATFMFLNGRWQALSRNSGPTANRPTSPANLEQYYDTTISCLLHWERGAWRTVDGSRGDLKYVGWETASLALQYNPGWEIYGTSESESVASRGRILVQATRDSDAAAETDLAVTGGVSKKTAGSNLGEEEHTLIVDELPAHTHDIKFSGAEGTVYNPVVGRFHGNSASGYPQNTETTEPTGSGVGHNNMPVVHARWLLRKT